MSNFKAVIWDMDGVMIDSMIHWIDTDNKLFLRYGIELTPDLVKLFTGKSMKENMTWLKNEYDLVESVEELVEERVHDTDIIYTELSDALPGVGQLVKSIGESNMKQAIASGSSLSRISTIVHRFGWSSEFDDLISVENVGYKGKPAPDVYLLAADKLGLSPEECVVIEDAENGVVSAKAAGMKCIGVPDERWSPGDFSKADLIVGSLLDKEIFHYLQLQ